MSDHMIVPADQILPARLFVIPLRGKPIFPGIFTPVMLPTPQEADTVEKAIAADSFIGLIMTKSEDTTNPGASDLFETGTAAKIVRRINQPDGGETIIISTVQQ